MKIRVQGMALIIMCGLLAACSSMQTSKSGSGTMMSGGDVGGSAVSSMDEIDRNKMFHALDNPPGKSTSWRNGNTGITYTVTPTKKVNVGGNQFCREYQVSKEVNSNVQNSTGTACVDKEGTWRSV